MTSRTRQSEPEPADRHPRACNALREDVYEKLQLNRNLSGCEAGPCLRPDSRRVRIR
jgi:hypothetical protein